MIKLIGLTVAAILIAAPLQQSTASNDNQTLIAKKCWPGHAQDDCEAGEE
jgi:hypothetical protein